MEKENNKGIKEVSICLLTLEIVLKTQNLVAWSDYAPYQDNTFYDTYLILQE